MPSQIIIKIAVFRGTPIDVHNTRQTAFFLEFQDELSTPSMTVELTGPVGLLACEEKEDMIPSKRPEFLQYIPVATTSGHNKEELKAILRNTEIKIDLDWNCQNWIGDALNRLSYRGFISYHQKDAAIEKMIDVVLEVEDED